MEEHKDIIEIKHGDTEETTSISFRKLKKVIMVLRAIAFHKRHNMIALLASKNELTAEVIASELDMSQAAVSQNLAVLRKTHVVNVEGKGKNAMYSLNYDQLKKLADLANTVG